MAAREGVGSARRAPDPQRGKRVTSDLERSSP